MEAEVIAKDAAFCHEHLDDFAVLILFSAFESIIREQILSVIQDERNRRSHAVVAQILDDAREQIEHGGFYRMLELFKGQDAAL